MQQDQQMIIVMLLVVMALMVSRDTHKLFAETTRTWAQFGSSNYKAISALTATVFFATIGGMYKNKLDIEHITQKNAQMVRDEKVFLDDRQDGLPTRRSVRSQPGNPLLRNALPQQPRSNESTLKSRADALPL